MNKRVFLTSMISIAVLAIACILLALPGQFASLGGSKTAFSGYEVIFNAGYVDGINYLNKNAGKGSLIEAFSLQLLSEYGCVVLIDILDINDSE